MTSGTFRQTQTPPWRQWRAAECECNYTDCQTVSCPVSAPLLMKWGLLNRSEMLYPLPLSLNCAFNGNQSRYFNLALVATETCRALINFLLVKLQLSKWWYMIENYINYSTEFNNWASYFSMDLYLIAWISSKVCSKPLTAFIRVLMLQQFISYEWNQFKL